MGMFDGYIQIRLIEQKLQTMEVQIYSIETSRQNQQLRIRSQDIRTIHDLKIQISKQLSMPIQNIRLLLNNRDLLVADDASIHQLNLTTTDKLKAIPKIAKQSQAVIPTNKLQPINVYLTKQWIIKMAHQLMRGKVMKQKLNKLTSTNGLLQFIIQKLSGYAPSFKHLLQNNNRQLFKLVQNWFQLDPTSNYQPKQYIIQQPAQYIQNLPILTSSHLVSDLSKLVTKKRAQEIVQISQNDAKWAIEIICRGQDALKRNQLIRMNSRELKTVGRLTEWQQQPFIFRWLNAPTNLTLRLQIYAFPQFLDVFILSMSHLNKSLHELLIKNRQYILAIIETCPPPLVIP